MRNLKRLRANKIRHPFGVGDDYNGAYAVSVEGVRLIVIASKSSGAERVCQCASACVAFVASAGWWDSHTSDGDGLSLGFPLKNEGVQKNGSG